MSVGIKKIKSVPEVADVTDFANIVGDFSVRRGTVADAGVIAGVRIDSWRATYRGILPVAYLDSMKVDESTALWTRILHAASDAACVFVAEIDGEIVGFAAGMTLSEPKLGFDSELTAIYLIPSVQRAGIGRRLVAHVASTLASAGANNMLAWVLSQNDIARQFYTKLGGELLTEQTFIWDDLEMQEVGYGWRTIRVN
ncbi:GNAT family N-acetyltransferase [Glaciimonas sp. Gout2]|uniref:GNAT family N-acetyltransferase n=1 Tax=unclassified Glaciimonas TaxID=2644401 RepID=UPI002B22922E|nr:MULTISPECIES: GNAT family N-acetyltransferase [unclassified Glaciimonas]MEB0013591.1 GNAT family N-acetyltransferase [Glaciimonas sp. Cout2]MEB0083208.1 GNAT family N-acetyltransferase [Glaciimonas sp. Gout2]